MKTADSKYFMGLVVMISAVLFYTTFPTLINGGILVLLTITCLLGASLLLGKMPKPAYCRPRWHSKRPDSPRMSRISVLMCAALLALVALAFALRLFEMRNSNIEAMAVSVGVVCWLLQLRDKRNEKANASNAKIAVRLQ